MFWICLSFFVHYVLSLSQTARSNANRCVGQEDISSNLWGTGDFLMLEAFSYSQMPTMGKDPEIKDDSSPTLPCIILSKVFKIIHKTACGLWEE